MFLSVWMKQKYWYYYLSNTNPLSSLINIWKPQLSEMDSEARFPAPQHHLYSGVHFYSSPSLNLIRCACHAWNPPSLPKGCSDPEDRCCEAMASLSTTRCPDQMMAPRASREGHISQVRERPSATDAAPTPERTRHNHLI